MKNFLAVFTGGQETMESSGWNSMSPEKRKELEGKGMQAWGAWMKTHENAVVVEGGPLGKTMGISSDGISKMTNKLCGYIVVKASSHEEAAKMFIDHPHFSIFPGEGIEIMECTSIPN